MQISPQDADEQLAQPWFTNYTDAVDMYDAPATLDALDAEARAEASGDTEFALFARGLSVSGPISLSREVHSIYVVKESLRCKQLVLGDAILAVEGKVEVQDWVVLPETEGCFDVRGHQIEGGDPDEFAAQIDCPFMALYSRELGKMLFYRRENGSPIRMHPDALVPELRSRDDFDGVLVEPFRARTGRSQFPLHDYDAFLLGRLETGASVLVK